MTEKDYIEFCKALESEHGKGFLKKYPANMRHVIRIFVHAGIILDHYKRHIFYQTDFDPNKVRKELEVIHALSKNWDPAVGYEYDHEGINLRVLHGLIGMATEASEILENLLLGEMDTTNMIEELGDIQWYEAILLDALKSSWTQIRTKNVQKLSKRYGDKWSQQKAVNRNLNEERQILEENE